MIVKAMASSVIVTLGGLLTFAHCVLLDGVGGLVWPLTTEMDTQYADAYTDQRFRAVKPGTSDAELTDLLGTATYSSLDYAAVAPACGHVRLVNDRVAEDTRRNGCPFDAVTPGATRASVIDSRGAAPRESRAYSWSPTSQSYRERVVVLERAKVISRVAEIYVD